jgi:hypothetical protein
VNEHEEQCFAHAHQLRSMVSSTSSLAPGNKHVVVKADVTAQLLRAYIFEVRNDWLVCLHQLHSFTEIHGLDSESAVKQPSL